jgi:hypothetical protein
MKPFNENGQLVGRSHSNRVFFDTKQREMDGRTDREDPDASFDTNDQDANDLERAIAVPDYSDFHPRM